MKVHIPFNPNSEFKFPEGLYITELLNRPDDDSCSIARGRIERGVSTKLHKVRGTVERYLILQGEALAEIDGEQIKVGPLDVVHVAPGVTQRVTNTGTLDFVFLAICTPRFRPENYQLLEP